MDEINQNNVSAAMAYIGRIGGLKGGPSRAKKLSPERRKFIAKKAALVRWGKKPIADEIAIKIESELSQNTARADALKNALAIIST